MQRIPHLKGAIELEPRNTLAYNRLSRIYEEMGRYDEALAYHEREYERGGHPFHLLRIASVQARMGKRDEARRTLARVHPSERLAVELAAIYTALGDTTKRPDGRGRPLMCARAPCCSSSRWIRRSPGCAPIRDGETCSVG